MCFFALSLLMRGALHLGRVIANKDARAQCHKQENCRRNDGSCCEIENCNGCFQHPALRISDGELSLEAYGILVAAAFAAV
jgi:hypothetical protein